MSKHYSEADLLETYYTQPGDSMPVMMHLADCQECAARYERLERKLRSLAACEHERPETFWARQRVSVMRRVGEHRAGAVSFGRVARVAAAAVLVLTVGGVMTWRQTRDSVPAARQPVALVATVSTSPPAETSTDAASDPWQSDQLKDFQSMVAWESWVEPGSSAGDQSL